MIMKEFVHHYDGFWGIPSKCHIRILNEENKNMVIICSQGRYQGTSITNNAENLISCIQRELHDKNTSLFYEFKSYWSKTKKSKMIFDFRELLKNSAILHDKESFVLALLKIFEILLAKSENYKSQKEKIDNLIWIEHYTAKASIIDSPIYFLTRFSPEDGKISWCPMPMKLLLELTGYNEDMLTVPGELVDAI